MKRGQSGLSLVVGVNKPQGMTSHDVVNRCRRIFGERRVGHTGTLDPMATGVLPICVGPATRLGPYLTGHDKHYRASIAFGAATDTDDAQGAVTRTGEVPSCVLDEGFARGFVADLAGERKQIPPAYSAVKVNGKKSYEQARAGNVIDLAPRDIVVYEARLIGVRCSEGGEYPSWDVEFFVSKGTYIRALARDVGIALGCPAHISALERTELAGLTIDECVSLDTLEDVRDRAALDPVALLGFRFAYVGDTLFKRVLNGASFGKGDVQLFEHRRVGAAAELCACTAGVLPSCEEPASGEMITMIAENKVVALYEYDAQRSQYRSRCVFQTGVSRGKDI